MGCIYIYQSKEYTKEEFYSFIGKTMLNKTSTNSPAYTQYLESLNRPYTNPILLNNPEEQVKKFTELQERLNNKGFTEAAKNAYESTPELQQFGTQEEYNDYIARVSLGILKNPSSGGFNYTSKLKDIVYHGSPSKKVVPINPNMVNNSERQHSKVGSQETQNPNNVNYQLKAIDILSSDKAKQVFEKGKKNGWSLDKILTELQIPKAQKQLILDRGLENNKPDVILPIGISGSGKSTFIKSLPQENLAVIEPDAMRVEFTGDMNDKSKDKEIYIEAANRAIKAIKAGKQVVFDTTNLTKEKRLPFIEAIKKEIPNANIQYKLMELNPELAKERIKAQLERIKTFEPTLKEKPVNINAKFPKDQVKANYVDGIIGYGTHSTGNYANAFGGTRTSFKQGEIIMISVNGNNRPNQKENVEKTKQAIDKAISQGVVAFIADNETIANSSHNSGGEGVIRNYMLSKGLVYKQFKGVGLYVVNRANVSDSTIDRHAESYKQMLEDIKNEPISNYSDISELTPEEVAIYVYSMFISLQKETENENEDAAKKEKARVQSNPINATKIELENIYNMLSLKSSVSAFEKIKDEGYGLLEVLKSLGFNEREKSIIINQGISETESKNLREDLMKSLNIAINSKLNEKLEQLKLDESGGKEQKTIDEMKSLIRKEIFDIARKNPGKTYVLGYNDFSSNYAEKYGYGPRDIASIIDEMSDEIPENLKLPLSFQGAMANSNHRIRVELEGRIAEQVSRGYVNMDGKVIQAQLERMYVPIVDDNGDTVGLYDEREQETALQTVIAKVYKYALSIDPSTPINKILNHGLWLMQKFELRAWKEGHKDLAEKYRRIVKSFAFTDGRPSFAKLVLRNFKSLRYNLDEKTENKILEFLAKQKDIYQAPVVDERLNGEEQVETVRDIEDENDPLQFEGYYSSIKSAGGVGEGVKSWNEISFEIDQRNTASTRMKMHFSTIAESEFGKYKEATNSGEGIDLSDIEDVTELTMEDALEAHNNRVWHDDPEMLNKIMDALNTVFRVIPFQNSLFTDQLASYDSLFEGVLAALAGQHERTIENYVKILRDSGVPNFIAVANSLDGINPGSKNSPLNEQLRNEFVKVMSKQYNQFLMVWSRLRTDSQGKQYSDARVISAQRSSQKQVIIKEWKESNKLSVMMKVNPESGVRTIDTRKTYDRHLSLVQAYDLFFNKLLIANPEQAKEIKTRIKELLKKAGFSGSYNDFKADSYGERLWMKEKFRTIFNMYGIDFNNDMIDTLFGKALGNYRISQETGFGEYDIIDAIENVTRNQKSHKGNLAKQFSFTKDGRPNGIFSAFFAKAAGVSNISNVDEDAIEEGEEQATLNNPLYTEGPAMKILASVAAKFTPVKHTHTHKTIDGKKVWDYSHNTALSKEFQGLKFDFKGSLERYKGLDLISNSGEDLEGSFYLRQWASDEKAFDKFELSYLEGLKFGGVGASGTIRQDMSDREHLLTAILSYQNGGKTEAHMISLTNADKTMTPIFSNIPKLNTGITNLDNNVLLEFKALFDGEYRRIAKQSGTSFNDAKYDEGKKYFFFLPQFNKEALEKRLGEHIQDGNNNIKITQEVIDSLWNANGTITKDLTKFKRPLMALLNEGIRARIRNTLDKLNETGLTSIHMYTKVVNRIKQAWHRVDPEITGEGLEQKVMEAIARDYAINSFLWNTNVSMLFYGDPAIAWAGSVEETMKDYTKRLAKDIAPGQDLAFAPGEKYTTITIADVKTAEDYLKRIGVHTESDATDAQELTTTEEYLYTEYKSGNITADVYKELTDVIKNKDANGMYKFNDRQLEIIFKPSKPVYAGFRAPSQGAMLYDYVKSSAYPLLPQFTADFEIDKLRILMENYEGGIQRANFVSAKKLGSPQNPAKLFDSEGKFTEDPNFKDAVQTLSRDGFRIQQDVPIDLEKDTIKIVSQMDGLITQGLPDTTFYIEGHEGMNRDGLKRLKRDVKKKMLDYNVNRLMEKLGSKKINGSWSKPSVDKLIEMMIEEAKERKYSDNEIDSLIYKTEDGQLEIPVFLHSAAEKFESLLMSLFRKVAVSKVPGLSAVQGSSIGYVREASKTNLSNVVWVGDFDGTSRLKHQREEIDENGKKVVRPAQVIVPFDFSYEDKSGNTIHADISDYTITDENGRKTLDTSKIPIELLQMIAARIPNQGHNSMMAVEIVGFMPKGVQNLILVPSAVPGQMGSDFDVDKLYMYRRGYKFEDGKFSAHKILTHNTENVLDAGEDWPDIKDTVINNLAKQGAIRDYNGRYDEGVFKQELNKVVVARYGENVPTRKTETELKAPMETEGSVNNEYFNIHWGVLLNPEMQTKVMSALDKNDLSIMNEKYAIKERSDHNYFDIIYQLDNFQKGKDAKILVAISSLATKINSTLEDKDVKLGTYVPVGKGKVKAIPTSIDIVYNGKSLALTHMSGRGTGMFNGEVRTKHDNLTIIQNAAVDYMKKRAFDNLNINTYTFSALAALHTLQTKDGEIVNVDFSTALTTQDIIWKFSKEMSMGNDSMSGNNMSNEKLKINVVKKLKNDLFIEYLKETESTYGINEDNVDDVGNEKYRFNDLMALVGKFEISDDVLNAPLKGVDKIVKDFAVLNLFMELDKYGERLSVLQKTFNQNTNGAGVNLVYAMKQQANYDNIPARNMAKIFIGEESLIRDTEQGYIFETLMDVVNTVSDPIFPRAIYAEMGNMLEQTGKDVSDISMKTMVNVLRAFRAFTFTSTSVFGTDPMAERQRLWVGSKVQESLAKRVVEAKALMPDNYFIERLYTNINMTANGPDEVGYENAKTVMMDDEKNVSSFMQLLNSKDEKVRSLAMDLIRYSYLTKSQNSPTSFITRIPSSFFVATGFAKDMRDQMEKSYSRFRSSTFEEQFYQHFPSETIEIDSEAFGAYSVKGQDFPEEFIIPNDYDDEHLWITRNDFTRECAEYVHFKSLSHGKTILYKQVGFNENPLYQRIDTLGNKEMDEFDGNAEATARSLFEENRAAKEYNGDESVFQVLRNQVNYMIAESEDPDDAMANWGMPEIGSSIDANNGLISISEDSSIPEYFRTIAELLTESSQTKEAEKNMMQLLTDEEKKSYVYPKFTIEVSDGEGTKEGITGSYNAYTNKMFIKKSGNKEKMAETFLHEMTHYRTATFVAAFGYTPKRVLDMMSPDELRHYNKLAAQNRADNPEVAKLFGRLDKMRYKALLVFQKLMKEQGQDYAAMLKKAESGRVTTENELLLYGMHNMDEFITHVQTNKKLMQFLNTIETEDGQGFVAKILDLISEILIQMSKFIGMDINEKALLKEAFLITMKLNNLNISDRFDIELSGDKMVPTVLPVKTENEAQRLNDHVKNGYKQESETKNHLTHWTVNVTANQVEPRSQAKHGALVQTIINQLKKQIREVNRGMSTIPKTEEDRSRYVSALQIRNEMQSDLEELERISNLSNIDELGKKQLDWVESILNKNKPNINETILASNILLMWKSLNETIYSTDKLQSVSDKYRKIVGELSERAENLNFRLLKFGSIAIRELGAARGVVVTDNDLRGGLKGPNEWKKLIVALSRDINPAMQLLTSVVQEAANNTDEEVRRHTIRLGKLEKMISAIPGPKEEVWGKFIQSSLDGSTWGLVQQIKAEWYKENDGDMRSLRNRLYKINTTMIRNSPDYIDGKAASYSKFWKNMFERNVVVDIRKLLDPKTGGRLNTPEAQKEYDRLIKEVGSKELVDTAITASIIRFEKYLTHEVQKMAEFDAMELTEDEKNNIKLSEETKATMSEAEIEAETTRLREDARDKKIAGYKKAWINKNSPAAFINTSEAANARNSLNHTLTFLPEFLPKKSSKLMDESYKEIQDDETLKAIYNEIKSMLNTFKEYFPPDVKQKLGENFLPVVTLHEVSSFFTMLKSLNKSKVGQALLGKVAITEAERNKQRKDEIPIDFIDRYGRSSNEFSKDIPKILEMFGNMAIHYKNMRPAQEVIEAIEIMVHNATINPNAVNGANTKRLEQMIKFYKDNLVFKKPKASEMVSKSPTYSLSPLANDKIKRRVSAIRKRMGVLTDNALNDPDFKLRRTESELADPNSKPTEMELLEEEASTYAEKARYYSGSKAGDFIIGIAQLKALAFNPFSAVNNLTFGVISAFIHAYGRADYTPSDLRWGFMKMRWSIAKSLTFNTKSPGEAEKIRNIADRVGLITEILDTMYGKSNLHTHTNYWQKLADPFAWQRSGDYLHKGALLLAMMKNQKVKVMEDGVEKEISLYDALDDSGEWNAAKYGENKEWSSDDIDEQKLWNKFRDKSRKVAMIVHGNQDKNSPLLGKFWVLGRLLGQFRFAWLGEGINSRLGAKGYDAQLGRDTKGRYITLAEFGPLESVRILFAQVMSVVTKKDAFAGRENRNGEAITPVDIENMRKNLAEICYLLMMAGAYVLVSMAGPDDDEKRRRKAAGLSNRNNQILLNMITRSYQDLALYTSPSVFDQVTGNLIPSMSVVNDAKAALWSVLALPFDDSKDAGSKTLRKVTRAIPGANLVNKWEYMATGNLRTAQR